MISGRCFWWARSNLSLRNDLSRRHTFVDMDRSSSCMLLTLQCTLNQRFRPSNFALSFVRPTSRMLRSIEWLEKDSIDASGDSDSSNSINSFLYNALVGFCPISSSVETTHNLSLMASEYATRSYLHPLPRRIAPPIRETLSGAFVGRCVTPVVSSVKRCASYFGPSDP
jgi:hypothetical protein